MHNFNDSFKNAGASVRMDDASRARMRARLLSHIQENPVSVPSPYRFSFSSFHLTMRSGVAAVLAVLVVGAGGTAYAADDALPGDALYAVKVGVNEPVAGALAVTVAGKAAHHAEVATTRLAEAEALVADGRLTATTSALLAADFDTHAQAAESLTDEIRASDPDTAAGLSAGFSASVQAKGEALLRASQDASGESRRAGAAFVRAFVSAKSGNLALNDMPVAPTAARMMKAAPQATVSNESGEEAVQMMMAMSATLAPEPVLMDAKMSVSEQSSAPDDDDLARAIAHASASLDAARDTLDASTTAALSVQLADLKLIPLAVSADEAGEDSDAAQADRERGIAAAAALETSIRMSIAAGDAPEEDDEDRPSGDADGHSGWWHHGWQDESGD